MRHGESPQVHRQMEEKIPNNSTAPRPDMGRTGKAKARAKTAREKGKEKEIKAEEINE